MLAMKQMVRTMVPRRLYKPLLLWRDRGDRVECPCCGGRFRTFWPSGVNQKPNTMCPGCNSLERHRLLWLYLNREMDVGARSTRLLHVAPEPLFERLLRSYPNVDYLSADLDSPLAMVRMDLTSIDMPSDSFDAIVCCHVLEHVPDDAAAMRELLRILRPGGWAILQSPVESDREKTYEDNSKSTPAERLQHFGQEDHVRVYGIDYRDRLASAGFDVQVIRYPDRLGPALTSRYALQPDEDVYLCRKAGG